MIIKLITIKINNGLLMLINCRTNKKKYLGFLLDIDETEEYNILLFIIM